MMDTTGLGLNWAIEAGGKLKAENDRLKTQLHNSEQRIIALQARVVELEAAASLLREELDVARHFSATWKGIAKAHRANSHMVRNKCYLEGDDTG